jgi:hypothetical protein
MVGRGRKVAIAGAGRVGWDAWLREVRRRERAPAAASAACAARHLSAALKAGRCGCPRRARSYWPAGARIMPALLLPPLDFATPNNAAARS